MREKPGKDPESFARKIARETEWADVIVLGPGIGMEDHARLMVENLDRSPIYSGVIEGVGPRYCPSIETKIVRFPDKPRHQLFIEPMGLDTEELYIQGFSSSMPEEVQIEMLHSVKGLEHAEIDAPGLRHRI